MAEKWWSLGNSWSLVLFCLTNRFLGAKDFGLFAGSTREKWSDQNRAQVEWR
jgi:hypothetical protein